MHFKVHRLQLKQTLQVKKQNNKDNTLKNKNVSGQQVVCEHVKTNEHTKINTLTHVLNCHVSSVLSCVPYFNVSFCILVGPVIRTEPPCVQFVDVCFWSEWLSCPSRRNHGLYSEEPGRRLQQDEEPELDSSPGPQRLSESVSSRPNWWACLYRFT